MAHTGPERRSVCQIQCEKVTETSLMVARIKTDLYNGDDDPEKGLVPEMRAWLSEERAARSRRWKRSDKIALLAVLSVILLPPSGVLTAKAVNFFGDLYQITQEWHQLHKSEIPKKSSSSNAEPSVSSSQKPTDAEIPPLVQTQTR